MLKSVHFVVAAKKLIRENNLRMEIEVVDLPEGVPERLFVDCLRLEGVYFTYILPMVWKEPYHYLK